MHKNTQIPSSTTFNTSFDSSSCIAHIDLHHIQHNYRHLCAQLPNNAQGMAILKSDAYGHGLLAVANALHQCGVPSFGVSYIDEAVSLRKAGFMQEIAMLQGAQNAEEMRLAIQENCMPFVYDQEGLRRAAAFATAENPARVVIKLETGMGRLGFMPSDIAQVLEFLHNEPHVHPQIVLSHLACADMPEKEYAIHEQYRIFTDMCASLQSHYPHVRRSLCNSAGALAYTQLGGEIFRLGIALYGGNPFIGTIWQNKGEGLKEAMRISAPIIHIFDVEAGQSISYGATYVAEHPMRIAVIGMGYANGLWRALSSQNNTPKAFFAIENKAAPICGRICMGMTMVDITHIPQACIGQRAWLTTGNEPFSLQKIAQILDTIVYEVQCVLGKNTRIFQCAEK